MQQQDFTITSLLFVAMGYAINASTFSKYDVLNGTKVEGNWSTIPNVDKGYKCCIACEQDAQCTAANHHEDNKTCELTHESDGLKSTTSPGWKAYFSYDVHMCTFDYGICHWTRNTRWNITSGSITPTGPRVDKTFGTASGMYLYVDDDNVYGYFKYILFDGLTGNQFTCLSFYYQSTTNISMYLYPGTSTKDLDLAYIVDTWMFISYTIRMKGANFIVFKLRTHGGGSDTVAIDDLLIKSGPCA